MRVVQEHTFHAPHVVLGQSPVVIAHRPPQIDDRVTGDASREIDVRLDVAECERARRGEDRLAAVQDPVLKDRFHLLSVSFDPEYDTPPVLAAHARRAGADTSSWSFVTGHAADIDRFASRFGVSIMRNQSPQEIVHSLRTAVIDADGRLVKVFDGNGWMTGDLVSELRNAIGRR